MGKTKKTYAQRAEQRRGNPNHTKNKQMSEENIERMLEYYAQWYSLDELKTVSADIAERLGIAEWIVRKDLVQRRLKKLKAEKYKNQSSLKTE